MTKKYIIIFGKQTQENQIVAKAIEKLADKKISIVTIPALVEKGEYGETLANNIIAKMEAVFVNEKVILIDLENYITNSNKIKKTKDGIEEINDDLTEKLPDWLEEYLNKRLLLQNETSD